MQTPNQKIIKWRQFKHTDNGMREIGLMRENVALRNV